jgi:hypothetical protein
LLTEAHKEEALEAASELAEGSDLALSQSEIDLFKSYFRSDSYDFTRLFCGHRDGVDSYHRPLSYLVNHQTEKLAAMLLKPNYPSYVLDEIRREMHRHEVFEDDPLFIKKLDRAIDFVNARLFRGSFKSSYITHGGITWALTHEPNHTNALMTGGDAAAIEWTMQIRETLEKPLWRAFYPERIPEGNLKEKWTQDRLFMGGRTISHPQWPLEARGFLSNWTRTHFNRFWTDDIVGEHTVESELPEIERRISGLTGLYMQKRRIWRVHVGTVWFPNDDHFFLKQIEKMFTIVIPIEVYPEGIPKSIRTRGIPTCRELFESEEQTAEEAITALQQEVFTTASDNGGQGEATWARNYLLDAGMGGAVMFPPSLINSSLYKKRTSGDRVEIGIPEFNKWGEPVYHGDSLQYHWRPLTDGFFSFYLGVDPAFSNAKSADDWAVSVIAVDKKGDYFVAYKERGKGWNKMIPVMERLALKWGVRKIGFEKQTAQEAIDDAIKFNPRMRRIARLIELFPAHSTTKADRIGALVASNMAANRLWIDEKDTETQREMEFYVPGPRAKDNILDSIAYGIMVAKPKKDTQKPKSALSDWQKHKRHRENRYNVKLYRNL